MKKILSLITAFSLIGGLTSCTAKAENVPADPPAAADRAQDILDSMTLEEKIGQMFFVRYPDDETGKTLYVKRIIGTPGDTVEMSNGTVYVNGKALQEDYIAEVTQGSYGPYVVPDGCYFMMGDNRNHSQDSRFWRNQYVEKDEILGKVVLRYYKGFKWIS